MSDSTPSAPTSSTSTYRFSLLGLLIFTLGIAVGLAAARVRETQPLFGVVVSWDWFLGVRGAVAVWLAIGLHSQIRDLSAAIRRQPPLSGDLRVGAIWALTWRVAVMIFCTSLVPLQHYLWSPQPAWSGELNVLHQTPDLILGLSLLAAIGHMTRPKPNQPSVWRRVLDLAVFLAAIIFGLLLAVEMMAIPSLVYFAVRGIELAQPFRSHGVEISHAGAFPHFYEQWIRGAAVAVLLSVFSAWLTVQLARRWHDGVRTRCIWGTMLGGVLAALAYDVGWAAFVGLPRLSQAEFETLPIREPAYGLTALILVIVVGGVGAWRLSAGGSAPDHQYLEWRPPGRRYCHEYSVLLLLPFAALLTNLSWVVWCRNPSRFWGFDERAFLFQVIVGIATDSQNLLWLAVFLAGARLIAGWLLRREVMWHSMIAPLPAAKFATIWIAASITTALAAASVAWFGFSVWLLPTLNWR